MSARVDRRALLRAGLALGAAALVPRPAGARTLAALAGARPRERGEPVLVLLQLTGGNDGLSTVVPVGDDAYHAARRSTRYAADQVLPLDAYRGLHPALAALHRRWEAGELALVEGVGYPGASRSHFRSLEVWHAADPRGRAAGPGWVGRLQEAAFGDDVDPARVVHVGTEPPYALRSPRHPATSLRAPEAFRWVAAEEDVASYAEAVGEAELPALERLRDVLRDAQAVSAAVRRAALAHVPRAAYPDDVLARDLRSAAALVAGGVGARVVSVAVSGFDTHASQRGQLDALLRRVDRALDAFLADLAAHGVHEDVLVVAFSEFGRRVEENRSGGTDHGRAGPVLVLGGRSRGGLHGRHPSLTALDDGDLAHTTDFRSVYGTAVRACFGADPAPVLGGTWPRLGFA